MIKIFRGNVSITEYLKKDLPAKFILLLFIVPLLLVIQIQPSIAQTSVLLQQQAAHKIAEEAYRRKQIASNVFHAPHEIANREFYLNFNRSDFIHKVTIGYTTYPRPYSAPEFATIERFAKSLLGTAYNPGGKNPSEGFDCSGFVLYVLRSCGSKFQICGSNEQYAHCMNIPVGKEMPGDLVFFNHTKENAEDSEATHVGIYLGNGQMIHASTSEGVSLQDIHSEYWEQRFLGFGRPW